MLKKLTSLAAVLIVAGATVVAGDVDLEGVKCVVAPKAANATKSADYKDAKVFFCCGNCQGKFEKNSKKFAVKANHQLVATKQYEQKGCPMSGKEVDPSTAVELAGTKVAFCCGNCQGKVEGAKDDDAKMKIVYNDKSFEKAFKKVEKKETE
ncbi:MAG: hypothetical protein HKN47_05690 [Pirellulaceae bacterium]|nr:hypothetical protein [Pirellulaceae bacterium]